MFVVVFAFLTHIAKDPQSAVGILRWENVLNTLGTVLNADYKDISRCGIPGRAYCGVFAFLSLIIFAFCPWIFMIFGFSGFWHKFSIPDNSLNTQQNWTKLDQMMPFTSFNLP